MNNRMSRPTALVAGTALMACLASAPASAALKDMFKKQGTAQEQRKEGVAQIPTCSKPIGTISVIEPEDAVNWWTGQQLPAPSKLIKVFVNKSRCFTLVDRGAGMAAAQYERGLASSGDLRAKSNLGKGQIKAADYVMVPDLIVNLDLDTGEPITTEVLRYGLRLKVLALPCNPLWRTPQGIELVGPRYFGYEVDYRPLQG